MKKQKLENRSLKNKINQFFFDTDTRSGRITEIFILIVILASVVAVLMESVQEVYVAYTEIFLTTEWFFTFFFTAEYILRIYSSKNPKDYIFSFYGLIDLFSIIPAYIGFFVPGADHLLIIRLLRMLRIFRILKLGRFISEGNLMVASLKASRDKILVFLLFMCILVTINGAVLYLIESPTNEGFSSIPRSIYWAIVTITTVGYGDISPQTDLGQFVAALVMFIGYAILVVPTGIVTVEMSQLSQQKFIKCPCGEERHVDEAIYCHQCKAKLVEKKDNAEKAEQ